MTYQVLAKELRTAAGKYQAVAAKMTKPVQITHVEPDSIGHVELAAWLKAVVDQCDKATAALKQGADGLATGLNTSATWYDTADEQAGQRFVSPLSGSGQGPVFGPFAPGTGPLGTGPLGTGPGGPTP